jgi:enoyl-CoA hydratase
VAELDPTIAAEYLTLYRDNAASTVAEAVGREQTRSLEWADRVFDPGNVAAVADAVIERGRRQG